MTGCKGCVQASIKQDDSLNEAGEREVDLVPAQRRNSSFPKGSRHIFFNVAFYKGIVTELVSGYSEGNVK